MSAQPHKDPHEDLDTFLDFLYEGLEGYVYVAAKDPTADKNNPKDTDWVQKFFSYPQQLPSLKRVILNASNTHEVYVAPAIFKEPNNAQKENFKASNVVWADFDKEAPDWDSFNSHPSLVVQSSIESRQHVYWRLTEPITNIEVQEDLNRRIAYNHGADLSGWDCNQVLRPPNTLNHFRSSGVKLVYRSNISYQNDVFDTLAPAPKEAAYTWTLTELPNLERVLLGYALTPEIQSLLSAENPSDGSGSRAKKLTQMAYACCALGMNDNEVFVMVRSLADKWGKFEGRNDKDKQIARIVSLARTKYPDALPYSNETFPVQLPGQTSVDDDEEDNDIFIYNYMDFMQAEIIMDWVVEGMLMEKGNLLIAGPSGVGKTQWILQLMKHIAIGKPFLHYNIDRPRKVGFLSLEMGHPDLRVFMDQQDKDLNDAERELLKENLDIIPYGEAWPLNLPAGQGVLESIIEARGWEGVFVDSIGSAILGNINSSETVQAFTNYNDRIRKKHGVFVGYIHHTRKAGPGQNGPSSQDDVYGDQYLVNRCTSAYGILFAKDENIRVRNFKNRLAKREHDYILSRTENINFIKVAEIPMELPGASKKDDPDEPTGANGISL